MIIKVFAAYNIVVEVDEIKAYTHRETEKVNTTRITFQQGWQAVRVHRDVCKLTREDRRTLRTITTAVGCDIESHRENRQAVGVAKRYKKWLSQLPKVEKILGIMYTRVATWNIRSMNGRVRHIEALHYQISILGLTEVNPDLNFAEYSTSGFTRRNPIQCLELDF
jgi:hypothetical protein